MSVNPIGTSEPTEAEILVLKRRIAELERSELFASIQRDTALAIVSDGSYRDSLKEILAVVCRLDEVDAGMVYVLNKAENVFDLVASHSLEETTQQMIRQFPSDDYPGQLAYINGPGYFDLNDSRYFPPEFDGLQGLHRVMIFPALLEDEVVASLIFATRSRSELPLDTSRTIEALSVLICESVARRSVEEALGASRASFQALFNSIEDMVFITDAHGVVLDCNPAVSKILGYSDEDICGNAVTTLSPDEMSEANCQGLKDLRDKQRVKFRMEVTTKEGLIIPVEVSAARAYWYNQEAMLGIARDLREEVKSEQMRTESEERFRSIVDGMTDYLFFLDEDCIFREFHCPGHSDRLLMPPEEFLGRRAVDCIPPQIVEDFEKAWSHLRAGNRVCELEYNLVDSKTNGWYRACLVRRNDPDGGFIGATAHIRDITANRHLDGELHSQRQRMELALRGGEIGIWDINTRNGTVYTGQNMNRILGQESKTTSSTLDEFRQIIHPADLHRFHREWGRYIGGKVQILELECRVAVQNDVWKWVLIRGAVNQTDEAGLPEHLSGILIDVDELRRVSEVAEERLQLLQTLIDTIPSPIYYKDITGRYLGCNQAFAQLMKMERDEIVGKTVHEMPEILYPLSCDDADHTLLHHPGVQVYEASIDKRDMSRQHYIYHKATFTNGEGELSGLVGVMIDISERQRNEEALRNAKEQAEALNRELSRSIEQANKLAVVAESANKAKSQFLANMSHEIRTPMNGIIGMAGLLLDSSIEGEEREFIQTILQSAEALMSIIGDILNLSQIEAGKLEPENSSFALRELCEDICSVLAVKAQAKGLNMACVIDPEVPTGINGDSGRLRQVLINLLGNAIKFTNEGEVNLIISQVPGDDPYHLRFEVADTGIGIPAENRDRLFEAFTQHDASSTRIHGGSGLGLAISRRLVEMMGGQLTVESEDGQGSVFGFDIVYNATGNVEILNLLPMTCLTGLNVLIADRMPMNRRAAVSILQDCCCEEAEDVDSLFQQLHTATAIGNPYDLVLIDHGLAPDEIEDVICRIKQGAKTSCPKLIVTRLMGQRRDVDRLVPGLIDATISKPLKSRQVFRTLCDLFSGETVSETHAESSGAGSRTTTLPSEPTRMRVLIAEDNVINQKVALGILEKLEYIPVLVGNGQEALRALQNAHFDLVLMDVQMPGMDGFEATRMIRLGRAGERNTNIPILAMTAYAMREDRERCLKVGMNDYIAKPVTVEQLGAKLDTWLRNKKATGRGARGSDQ